MSSSMPDDVAPLRVDELNALRSMAVRLRASARLDLHEVECKLEAGFGALIGLEAELARGRRRSPADPGQRTAATDQLQQRIIELREALTELRMLSAPPGQSRIGYGFVLPRDGPNLHDHPN